MRRPFPMGGWARLRARADMSPQEDPGCCCGCTVTSDATSDTQVTQATDKRASPTAPAFRGTNTPPVTSSYPNPSSKDANSYMVRND